MTEKEPSRLDRLVNIGLLFVIVFLLLSRGSHFRTSFDAWREKVRISDLVDENWQSLASTTSRMDTIEGGLAWLVEFGDYECPFCRRSHPALEKLVASNPGLMIAYRHYPLSSLHPKADGAARAAVCAEEQGRFPHMHSLLLTTTDWTETEDWAMLADLAGVSDQTEFSRCLTGEAVKKRLEEDKRLGDALGVTATPTFFYRSGMHRGYLDENGLAALLEATRRAAER